MSYSYPRTRYPLSAKLGDAAMALAAVAGCAVLIALLFIASQRAPAPIAPMAEIRLVCWTATAEPGAALRYAAGAEPQPAMICHGLTR